MPNKVFGQNLVSFTNRKTMLNNINNRLLILCLENNSVNSCGFNRDAIYYSDTVNQGSEQQYNNKKDTKTSCTIFDISKTIKNKLDKIDNDVDYIKYFYTYTVYD